MSKLIPPELIIMKARFLLFIMLLFSIAMPAQLSNSSWLHHLGNVDFYLDFQENTVALGIVGDIRPLNFSTFKLDSDTLKFIDLSGGQLCEPSKTEAGIYKLQQNEAKDSIYLNLIHDECLARGETLNGLGWSLDLSESDKDLIYVVIQILNDEIVVSGNRNPEALYITDMTGSPIQSVKDQNYIGLADLNKGDKILTAFE